MPEKKVALVTGAGRGLGAHLVRRLAHKGYAVALHYRTSKQEADHLVQELKLLEGDVLAIEGQIETQVEAEKVMATVLQHWSRLDVLINNAGQYEPVPLNEMTDTTWQAGLNSTLHAAYQMTRAALPSLRLTQGRVLMIGDSSCDRPTARDLALSYHIGKTGVLMLAKSLAQAEARHGLTINCISPGYLENSVGLPSPESLPAQRYGTLDDIWNAIDFLLQPESSYINGTNLVVSGGWNLR